MVEAEPLLCVCMYIWTGMLSTWPGVQGHEPPPPEQEASPQGQLLALKGPTHPWLNAPGLLCPQGCWFYRPIHSIAPKWREAENLMTCLMLEENQHAHTHNCVYVNTHTHRQGTCPLNQSASLPSHACSTRSWSFVLVWPALSWEMSSTSWLLIGYWQQPVHLMLPPCITVVTQSSHFGWRIDVLPNTCSIQHSLDSHSS